MPSQMTNDDHEGAKARRTEADQQAGLAGADLPATANKEDMAQADRKGLLTMLKWRICLRLTMGKGEGGWPWLT